jgi:hypothetical protein
VITDGKITARTRCANRIEETPHEEAAAPVEPPVEKFEEPVRAGSGTAMQAPPVAFESALLNRPGAPGLGPAGPLSLYDPFSGGTFVPISAPPLPEGLCGPGKKRKGGIDGGETGIGKKKRKPGPCGASGGPATVPEPGTWLLFASGFAAIYWLGRRRLVSA